MDNLWITEWNNSMEKKSYFGQDDYELDDWVQSIRLFLFELMIDTENFE